MPELSKQYSPKDMEDRIYRNWENKGYFRAKINHHQKPFSIVIPPPNVTGQLHMGHAMDETVQDIIIRFKRMQGYAALWQPGTDHASISTEVKVIEQLKKEGIDKNALGREGFLKRAWEWKEEYGGRITQQLKKLGSSCDWERERFTMDEQCSRAVNEAFVRMYDKGFIYQGAKLINWCPVCKTTISDAEVEYVEKPGHLWHIKYPVDGSNEFLTFATTRPETILGDTAVAVHPNDSRYSSLVGKTLTLPFINRKIPVIADDYVDMKFGTGVVKITPAHDPNDFEVGKRHQLPQINIMADDATINENGGVYAGMERYAARAQILKDLEASGLLVKTQDYTHNVGTHDRCNTVIEPLIKKQWFVRMDELIAPAAKAVRSGDIQLIPPRIDKLYFQWTDNIRDWCISRQLWWGHRIPAYTCEDCGHLMVSRQPPLTCQKCGGAALSQDPDVLDTWFSSALWPFSTLGWPEKTPDLAYFYPTSVLVTGYDILFFWVIRMVFSGYEHMGQKPFDTVLFHGLVRDEFGRKMSKSLGNGIDPLVTIEKYGADALRFALIMGNDLSKDMNFSDQKMDSSRNFANKVWNSARFIMMHVNADDGSDNIDLSKLKTEDRYILYACNHTIKETTRQMEQFELGVAVSKIYDFIWDEFCDWYIEMVKPRLYDLTSDSRNAALYTLKTVLTQSLKLLHPFMPFITEEIFLTLNPDEESIMISQYPTENTAWNFKKEAACIETVKEAIRGIRAARLGADVPHGKKHTVFVVSQDDVILETFNACKGFFMSLGSASDVMIAKDKSGISDDAISIVIDRANIYIPLDELIDKEKEKQRLLKEEQRLLKEIERVDGMLANERFVSKAPPSKIEEERAKKTAYAKMLQKVTEALQKL